jgi:hypothetical protein
MSAQPTPIPLGCNYEAPTFGAHYPDGTCIDGFMWDLDSGDDRGLTGGGDIPCPWCNTAEHIDYNDHHFTGNARQRRIARRALIVKVRSWAQRRASFPPATKDAS